ncbi:hypothetical protein [Novosphingobium sp. CECT 9465]|uniref:hypothetical protein n=1 Tax=Novosphingobium sp. CECT 9465 TaxID=2829794 RepID=UPI001E44A05E|nr:hypothetical protein [Novosphingobium sp. CECT 9465]CAH0498466.1 hypothetical protein NVSP9465_03554 [Novosphingobium sp. CECT 9465]
MRAVLDQWAAAASIMSTALAAKLGLNDGERRMISGWGLSAKARCCWSATSTYSSPAKPVAYPLPSLVI